MSLSFDVEIKQRVSVPVHTRWLDEFIASRSFDLTILTLNETTQRGIQLGLGDYLRRVLAVDLNRFPTHSGESLPFSTQTFVVPGLIDVIPGAPSMQG